MYLHIPACPACTQTCLYTIISCHITIFALSYHHPISTTPPQLPMGPKPKSNTRSGLFRAPTNSRKRQGSNANQQPPKRTRRTANDANDDDKRESKEEQEGDSEAEEDNNDNVVPPPPSRGGKRGRGVKKGPPQRYAGHDR